MVETPEDGDVEQAGDEVLALVQSVLRESHLENTLQLRDYADKVKHINQQKKAIRAHLTAAREMNSQVMAMARERDIELCQPSAEDRAAVASLIEELASAHEVTEIEYELCIPDRVPPEGVTTLGGIDAELARWEDELRSVGDGGQLANVDLQNALQKQQQTLQMMSNISKMLHDTTMSIIRKIGS